MVELPIRVVAGVAPLPLLAFCCTSFEFQSDKKAPRHQMTESAGRVNGLQGLHDENWFGWALFSS